MTGTTPEQRSRANIDRLLNQADWMVQDMAALNVHAARGVAVREFPLLHGHGFADYLLYVDGRAAGVVEAKPEGHTLTGVEAQSEKYGDGLPDTLPYYVRPLPFLYESTGVETRFSNGLDPQPRSRNVFSFHTPETLAESLGAQDAPAGASPDGPELIADAGGGGYRIRHSLRRRLTVMPPLDDSNLWTVQGQAIRNLEQSLAEARPRALVQMATGSGKTFMACNQVCTGSSGTPAPAGCCSSSTAATWGGRRSGNSRASPCPATGASSPSFTTSSSSSPPASTRSAGSASPPSSGFIPC